MISTQTQLQLATADFRNAQVACAIFGTIDAEWSGFGSCENEIRFASFDRGSKPTEVNSRLDTGFMPIEIGSNKEAPKNFAYQRGSKAVNLRAS